MAGRPTGRRGDERRDAGARPALGPSQRPAPSALLAAGAGAQAWASPLVSYRDVLTLQRLAGNRAVATAVAGPPVVQRVATNLVAGLVEGDPSTYDSGGGHSYADHGAHTTKEQHVTRVKTGVAPSGRESRVPPGKGSSKFASNDKHKAAFTAALVDIRAKNLPKQRARGAANQMALAGAGTIYFKDATEKACDKVQLDIVPTDVSTIRINSMYPVE